MSKFSFPNQVAAGSCEPVRYMHFSFLALVEETGTAKFRRTIFEGLVENLPVCDSNLFSKDTVPCTGSFQLVFFSLRDQLQRPTDFH